MVHPSTERNTLLLVVPTRNHDTMMNDEKTTPRATSVVDYKNRLLFTPFIILFLLRTYYVVALHSIIWARSRSQKKDSRKKKNPLSEEDEETGQPTTTKPHPLFFFFVLSRECIYIYTSIDAMHNNSNVALKKNHECQPSPPYPLITRGSFHHVPNREIPKQILHYHHHHHYHLLRIRHTPW